MASEWIERELKYEVDESFVVPNLDLPRGSRVETVAESLDACTTTPPAGTF